MIISNTTNSPLTLLQAETCQSQAEESGREREALQQHLQEAQEKHTALLQEHCSLVTRFEALQVTQEKRKEVVEAKDEDDWAVRMVVCRRVTLTQRGSMDSS